MESELSDIWMGFKLSSNRSARFAKLAWLDVDQRASTS